MYFNDYYNNDDKRVHLNGLPKHVENMSKGRNVHIIVLRV
jgi:hypothetical protein